MKRLLVISFFFLSLFYIKAQSIVCPPDVDIRLSETYPDFDFGTPTVSGFQNHILEVEHLNKYLCTPSSDIFFIDTLTYRVKVNGVAQASCKQTIVIRQLQYDEMTFPDSLVIHLDKNITAFDLNLNGDITPRSYDLAFQSNIFSKHSDQLFLLDDHFAKILRKWELINWCSGEFKEYAQVMTIQNKRTLKGVEARTLSNQTLTGFNYKIRVNDQCSTYMHNEALLMECELIKNNRIEFDSLNANQIQPIINVLDLVAIQRHILGIKKFEYPWQLMAADVNKDGKITVVDLVIIRKNILGLSSELKESVVLIPYRLKDKVANGQLPSLTEINLLQYDSSGIQDDTYIILAIAAGDVTWP